MMGGTLCMGKEVEDNGISCLVGHMTQERAGVASKRLCGLPFIHGVG